MKVKDLIKELLKLDQEEEIIISESRTAQIYNFKPFSSPTGIVKKDMQYRSDLFVWSEAIFSQKKYPIQKKYVLK